MEKVAEHCKRLQLIVLLYYVVRDLKLGEDNMIKSAATAVHMRTFVCILRRLVAFVTDAPSQDVVLNEMVEAMQVMYDGDLETLNEALCHLRGGEYQGAALDALNGALAMMRADVPPAVRWSADGDILDLWDLSGQTDYNVRGGVVLVADTIYKLLLPCSKWALHGDGARYILSGRTMCRSFLERRDAQDDRPMYTLENVKQLKNEISWMYEAVGQSHAILGAIQKERLKSWIEELDDQINLHEDVTYEPDRYEELEVYCKRYCKIFDILGTATDVCTMLCMKVHDMFFSDDKRAVTSCYNQDVDEQAHAWIEQLKRVWLLIENTRTRIEGKILLCIDQWNHFADACDTVRRDFQAYASAQA